MSTLTVPKRTEAKERIAEYLAAMPLEGVSDARREQIMRNSLCSIVLLIEAVELAGAAGQEEEFVLIQFVRALYAQAETVKRQAYFRNLMLKLRPHERPAAPL